MVKVIKHGKKEFTGQCSKCACIFSYELSDLYQGIGYRLNCPECGEYYYYPSQYNLPDPDNTDTVPTINLNISEER